VTSASGSATRSPPSGTASSGRSRATPTTRFPAAVCARAAPAASRHFDSDPSGPHRLRASVRGEEKVDRGHHLGRGPRARREKMQKIKAEYGPRPSRRLQPRPRRDVLKHTMKAFARRTPPRRPSPSAAGPRDVGFELTFGEAMARRAHRHPECPLPRPHRLALGENMHNHQVQEFADAVGAGASIIVADPASRSRRRKARHYCRQAGTAVALLLPG